MTTRSRAFLSSAARMQTKTIPIVVTSSNPVGLGFVASLARPGGNATGVANRTNTLDIKRLELLRDLAPRVLGALVRRHGDITARLLRLFGFNLDLLLIRIDCERPARTVLPDFEAWRIGFIEPAGCEVRIDHPARPNQAVEFLRAGARVEAPDVAVGIDQIAEVAIPFDRLGVAVDGPVQFFVELLQGGQGRDRAPREGTIVLTRPSRDFEQIMWDV